MVVNAKKKSRRIEKSMSDHVNAGGLTNTLAEAIRYHQAGNLAKAESLYRHILLSDPVNADALHLLGVAAYQTGNNRQAAEHIRNAININPNVSYYHNNLGNALLNTGDEDEAADCYREAIKLMPANAEAHNNLGNALKVQGQFSDAIQEYKKAIQIDPGHAAALNNMANLLKETGKTDEAIAHYKKAIEHKPDSAETYFNLGSAFEEAGRLEEAVDHFRKALEINRDFAAAYNDLANVLKKRKQYDESESHYKKAIDLQPDFAKAYANLGDLYREMGRFDDSLEQCRKAIHLQPGPATAYVTLGNTFLDRGDYDEAVEQYQKAIDIDHDLADAHYNKGLVMLMKGQFEKGWKEYEWRFKSREISRDIGYRRSEIPEWDGSSLDGKSILIVTEQGMGDHIQFLRYIPLVNEKGGRVVFECRKELLRLFEGYEGIDVLWERSSCDIRDLNLDVCVHLLSLPRIFGTSMKTISSDVPYLDADPVIINKWKSRFNQDLFNVGLVWSGNPSHRNDHNRSCRLLDFAPLASIPKVAFYSLQKGGIDENGLRPPADMSIEDLGKDLDDFYDTAAVMENLDLVISVDTAVVHLAGALGRSVWTLLPFVPDWRWMLDRIDTPWYPTMRLFRQPRYKDWKSVMDEVAVELEKKVLLKGVSYE
ncbi:MAG: hypothetical protein AMK70_11270 [Nitrospira bacterium SG8_35_1]|nr:MAG: hypothetical protein AMK70_11270 [Nitrospira bacterium SG8_35_1]